MSTWRCSISLSILYFCVSFFSIYYCDKGSKLNSTGCFKEFHNISDIFSNIRTLSRTQGKLASNLISLLPMPNLSMLEFSVKLSMECFGILFYAEKTIFCVAYSTESILNKRSKFCCYCVCSQIFLK